MAYITKEKVADIRKNLKAAFPAKDGWKFSVRIDRGTSLDVSILSAPYDLIAENSQLDGYDTDRRYIQVNHYHIDRHGWTDRAAADLKAITKIANDGNHDNSDSMTDYFDVGWWFHLAVGKWDKPFAVK